MRIEDFRDLFKKTSQEGGLSHEEASQLFDALLSGEASIAQTAAFLTALSVREETAEETAALVLTLRARMITLKAPEDAIDVVGTGGDGTHSWNVSTLAALIAASCGVPVVKHGNRAASSRCGSADVLESLGVRINLPVAEAERCLNETNFCFLFAPAYHPVMRNVAAIRRELGFRTIFNLAGPLANPARVKKILLGVFSSIWQEKMLQALMRLGVSDAWIVHGDDFDEITTSGETNVLELRKDNVSSFTLTPEAAGLRRVKKEALKGGEPFENAAALLAVLNGEKTPYRDIALLNAGAACLIANRCSSLKEGVHLCAEALDRGETRALLQKLIQFSP